MVCYLLAALCLLYCIGIVLTKAAGTKFFLVWIGIALFFAGLGRGLEKGVFLLWPGWLRTCLAAGLCAAVLLFCLIEGLILSRFFSDGKEGLSYIVVLGAQMKENGPSVVLARRLDRAYEYLMENPDTVCIVSGGKGGNEPVTEAQGMRDYLVKKGIPKQRILLEDQSRNTDQNLEFSRKLIPQEVSEVGIVTSNFHVYRSTQLAKQKGYSGVQGIAATSGVYFLPNNMLREFFGVMKDWMFGNMELFG